MKRILILALIVLLSSCTWWKPDVITIQDPQAEAIKILQLNLDPLPSLDLSPYQTDKIPLYIKKPGPGTKFEVDYDWIQKNEQLLIELQNRINLLEKRSAINKELFETAKKVGTKKPD